MHTGRATQADRDEFSVSDRRSFDKGDGALLVADIDRKSGASCNFEIAMTTIDRPLNIVRMIISSTDDHQIFDPPGDKKLAP